MSYYEESLVFTKMHVCGNDFCLINRTSDRYSITPSAIQYLGNRHTGIGFDQLILLERSTDSNNAVAVQFFNSDGTITEQCGNGCIAVAAFLHKQRLVRESEVRLEVSNQITECEIIQFNSRNEYTVEINLGSPNFHPNDVPFHSYKQQRQYELEVPSQAKPLFVSVLSLGNPHAVVVVPSLDSAPLDILGVEIQQHEAFPRSTNVEILEIQDDSNGKIRIFERGVGETQASGTGAAAATVAGQCLDFFADSVNISMPGGTVSVRWEGQDSAVIVRGKPSFAFTGTIPFSSFS